jgi:hypothetical protein
MLKRLLRLLRRLICLVRYHEWPLDEFGAFEMRHEHHLKFCKRCGVEFYGRTLADLRAMPFEDIEEPRADYRDWSED